MPEWLSSSFTNGSGTTPMSLAWRIGLALVLGVAVAALNRWARRSEEVPPTFQTTLVLLSALIAMATQIIGDNIARAFSLVGALSVVRFRTVVKDTQDTAFVIFAVVVGMAAGANHVAVAVVGLCLLAAASLILWPPGRGNGSSGQQLALSLRVGLAEGIRMAAESAIAASADRHLLVAARTAKQGSVLELTYHLRLRPGCSLAGLVTELNGLEGVDSVELGGSE